MADRSDNKSSFSLESETRVPGLTQKAKPWRNHLAEEASLYLRQHAHSPVDWYPWSPDALRRAKDQNRPIFLSIGYASCHWCHVMEREVFMDDGVASLLNAHFVAIKVDREERPDLDHIYMDALVRMTGSGGWPLSAFLTPAGQTFYAGTYFPKKHFVTLLQQLDQVWQAHPEQLEQQALRVQQALLPPQLVSSEQGLDAKILDRATELLLDLQDHQHGGLRGRQKFPTPPRWQFALQRFRRHGDPELGQMLTRLLDNMALGGLHDHLAGGFHRYSVEPSWTLPHFEKMLYDNAQLIRFFSDAAVALKRPEYLQVATDSADFLLREMADESGLFAASFDADSEGVEGLYYLWTPAQFLELLGPDAGPQAVQVWGLDRPPVLDGMHVLQRRKSLSQLAQGLDLSSAALNKKITAWQQSLLAKRGQRIAPRLDQKVVTAWNGMALQALCRLARLSLKPNYQRAATQLGASLWRQQRDDQGRLHRSSDDGRLGPLAIVDDYAQLALGFLELFSISQDLTDWDRARSLIDEAQQLFAAPNGRYFLSQAEALAEISAPSERPWEWRDGVEPSGNAALLQAMWRAAQLSGHLGWRDQVRKNIAQVRPMVEHQALEMGAWLSVADWIEGPYFTVQIFGQGPQAEALRQAYEALQLEHAGLLLIPDDVSLATMRTRFADLPKVFPAQQQASAQVCKEGLCYPPVSDAQALRALLQEN